MTDIVREHVTDRAHGIDVSHYQETYIYAKTIGQVDFAIAKIGEGHNVPYSNSKLGDWTDFNKIWIGGVDQVDMRLLYHYQRGGVGYSWEKQATLVLEAARRLSPVVHGLALDYEKINNELYYQTETMLADFRRIIDFWRANSKYKVLGYWNKDIWYTLWTKGYQYFGQSYRDWLLGLDAWYAQYWFLWDPNKQPGTPSTRSDWDIYQYTNEGDKYIYVNGERWRRYGSPDLDVYNGTVPQMRSWLGVDVVTPPPPPPPPTPEPVEENKPWVVITTGGARVHKTPDTSSASVVGGVLRDSTVWGTETPDKQFVEMHGFLSTITVKAPTESSPPPPPPIPPQSTRPTNLARIKWMFQRPENVRPNIWWKKPDILPGRIDDTIDLEKKQQEFWFGLLLQNRPENWTDEQMISAWRSLTKGDRAFTNGHGSDNGCADYISGLNLDNNPIMMDKMRFVGGGVGHVLEPDKTTLVRGIACKMVEVLDPDGPLDPEKINNALTPWLVGIATNDYKDPVTHVGGFPQLDGHLVQIPYFGHGGYNLIPASCLEMLPDDSPIPSPFYDPH